MPNLKLSDPLPKKKYITVVLEGEKGGQVTFRTSRFNDVIDMVQVAYGWITNTDAALCRSEDLEIVSWHEGSATLTVKRVDP